MGANTIQVPLLCQKCKRRDSNARTVSKPPLAKRASSTKRHISAYPSWSSFSFFYALFEWCVVVAGRPVPGSHPSSRRSYGGLTRRCESCCLFSTASDHRRRHRHSTASHQGPASGLHLGTGSVSAGGQGHGRIMRKQGPGHRQGSAPNRLIVYNTCI